MSLTFVILVLQSINNLTNQQTLLSSSIFKGTEDVGQLGTGIKMWQR
jgi:hypothetical protein